MLVLNYRSTAPGSETKKNALGQKWCKINDICVNVHMNDNKRLLKCNNSH